VVRRLLVESDVLVFNLDKWSCVSDLTSIEALPQAAENHVDRSIEGPAAYGSMSSPDFVYIDSNVTGTFHLLQAVRAHWEQLPSERRFSEITPYDPRKAASDQLVNAWHHTYGLPAGGTHQVLEQSAGPESSM
jgi:dTDP-glucose 4,6-dehydratase